MCSVFRGCDSGDNNLWNYMEGGSYLFFHIHCWRPCDYAVHSGSNVGIDFFRKLLEKKKKAIKKPMKPTVRNLIYHCATILFGLVFLFALAITIGGWNDSALLGSRLRRVIGVAVVLTSLSIAVFARILRKGWLRNEGIYLSPGLFRAYYDEQTLGVRGFGRLVKKYSIGEPPPSFHEYRMLYDSLSNNTITEAEFRRKVDEMINKRGEGGVIP